MLEWRHLHLGLLDEFERDAAAHPELGEAARLFARRALAELCGDGVCESADQYVRLQQVDASGRVDDLEQALARLGELERARTTVWREAAHDLRGNLGVVQNATELLNLPEVPEATRQKSLGILQQSVNALQALLGDMASLARLEAGREVLNPGRFDAAELLLRLGEDFQAMATQRGLFLQTAGPPSLPVEGDAVKVRRIAQNLLANALQYTERGGVRLTWGAQDDEHWFLCVQDSGPGIARINAVPLARAIRNATGSAQDAAGQNGDAPAPQAPPALPALGAGGGRKVGEGIGLSIVKRLCELLNAVIEVETAPGKGLSLIHI